MPTNQPTNETMSERPYLAPYEKATREMGAGFESQLWMSKDAQRTRFEMLTLLGRFPGRIVADLGCGVGDLPMFLHEHAAGEFPRSYIGIEGVEAMARLARERVQEAKIERAGFELGDFVADDGLALRLVKEHGAEVFVFSGSLNTLDMAGAQGVLDRFWSALRTAKRGTLVFNFLSDRHNAQRTPASAPAVRYDPSKMLDWALERTPIVQLRHDYLRGHDATIVMDVAQ